ncbi:MAG: N-acetylmuramoyl-L-alanine amidase [Patescibacteria group bacterium]
MKKWILIIAGCIILLGAVAFGWFFVRKDKTAAYTNTVETLVLLNEADQEKESVTEEGVEKVPAPLEVSSPLETEEETKKEEVQDKEPAKKVSGGPSIISRLMSSGYAKSSGRKIDTVVIHSSYDALGSDPYSVSGLIKEYESYGVSAHYLIDRKGNVYRLVEDTNIAYHAGSSTMKDGRSNVNNFSIGIEMMNLDDGKSEYTSAQYASVNSLVSSLKSQYAITSVVGHDDIAPGRKTDPWNFDWKKLK